MQDIATVDILGVKIAVTTLENTLQRAKQWISEGARVYFCFAPVSTLVDCQSSADYRQVINNAAMANPDGMPLVWVGRAKGHKTMRRTGGPDFMLEACQGGLEAGHRHFFYGGTDENNARMIANLQQRFPGLIVAGAIAPPFRQVGEMEDQALIDQINAARPDYLWIGLGSPKQDYWMANHRDRLDVPVICGVGAAFDFHAGVKPLAPRWMQRSGLEWFFRLCCEPRRLWKRYVIGNTKFIYYMITRELFSHG